jgi:hypothetical protein
MDLTVCNICTFFSVLWNSWLKHCPPCLVDIVSTVNEENASETVIEYRHIAATGIKFRVQANPPFCCVTPPYCAYNIWIPNFRYRPVAHWRFHHTFFCRNPRSHSVTYVVSVTLQNHRSVVRNLLWQVKTSTLVHWWRCTLLIRHIFRISRDSDYPYFHLCLFTVFRDKYRDVNPD